ILWFTSRRYRTTSRFPYTSLFRSDPNVCYHYKNGHDVFEAHKEAGGANGHYCGTGNGWSGNFLNWMTMSRLDIVRHVLYGGKRVTDTKDRTILAGAHVPNDLHSWVKVYSGS